MRNSIYLLLLSTPNFLRADPGPLVLSSAAPATSWNREAYPVGNGRLAAMVFGGVGSDEIQFNEDTLWTGQPHFYENPGATPTNLASMQTTVFNHQPLSSAQQSNFMSVPLRQAMYEPAGSSSLLVTNADAATLLLSVASNFVDYGDLSANPAAICSNNIVAAAAMTYGDLRRARLEDYRGLFHRVVLDLGSTSKTNLPTGERIKRADEGDDPQLAALYFQMGRYLMISGSRPGSQPLNLQGKGNDNINPSWESKMTLNINKEMNYWAADSRWTSNGKATIARRPRSCPGLATPAACARNGPSA